MINNKSTIIKITTLIIIIISLFIILFILINQQNNSDQPSIKINNLSQYYDDNIISRIDTPIAGALEAILQVNHVTTTPTDITINNTPVLYQYNSQTNFYSGEFLIDIPSLQQSYQVSFNLPQDPATTYINPVEISCPSSEVQLYSNFNCTNRGQH